MYAIQYQAYETAILLLQKGCDINITDKENNTAFHIACQLGDDINMYPIIEALILKGDAMGEGGEGGLPDELFFQSKSLEEFFKRGFFFLKYDRILDEPNFRYCRNLKCDQKIYLGQQCYIFPEENPGFFIHLNCVCNFPNAKRQNSLHICKSDEGIRLILQHGAFINSFDEEDNTPLHTAVLENRLSNVKTLLENGASHIIKNKFHKTALQMCQENVSKDLVLLLLNRDLPYKIKDSNLEFIDGHNYSWSSFLDASCNIKGVTRIEVIKDILNNSLIGMNNQVEILRELIFFKDAEGRKVVDITDSETRQFFYDLVLFWY